MLTELIERAIDMRASGLEIEYKDGREWITALGEGVGVGIGSVERKDRKTLFEEMETLKRDKVINVSGDVYRLKFSKYESFGEWVYRIEWKKKQDRTTASI